MSPNEAVARAKQIIAECPAKGVDLQAAWNRVCDAIQARALAAKVKPRVFEVHHETEVARSELMIQFAAGSSIAMCEAAALAKIRL